MGPADGVSGNASSQYSSVEPEFTDPCLSVRLGRTGSVAPGGRPLDLRCVTAAASGKSSVSNLWSLGVVWSLAVTRGDLIN